jgi:hypothetical protein
VWSSAAPVGRDPQHDQVRAALVSWALDHDELVSVCMTCDDVYDHKSSEGTPGGLSHGLCPYCAEHGRRKGR